MDICLERVYITDELSRRSVYKLYFIVHNTFTSVAGKYDIMNDVMSFGIHHLWKDYFVQKLDLIGNVKILDVAGGTGDLAFRLKDYKSRFSNTNNNYEVTVLDSNNEMLAEGKMKTRGNGNFE